MRGGVTANSLNYTLVTHCSIPTYVLHANIDDVIFKVRPPVLCSRNCNLFFYENHLTYMCIPCPCMIEHRHVSSIPDCSSTTHATRLNPQNPPLRTCPGGPANVVTRASSTYISVTNTCRPTRNACVEVSSTQLVLSSSLHVW